MGISTGKFLDWHLKQAMVMAGQLPPEAADARLVLEAIHYLLDNYLSQSRDAEHPVRGSNILPFTG
jgi:uncharacterized membrane protein